MNARELYIAAVKKLSCPRCGTQTLGGDGFWSTSKPYCSFCGWNVDRAKELERSSLRQLSWTLPLIAAFFGAMAYFLKQEFALFPFLFLCVFMVLTAVVSWKRLKLLNESHSAAEYAVGLASTTAAEQIKRNRGSAPHVLLTLTKPRRVRLKPVPLAICVAFPISWIFILYFAFQIVRNAVAASNMGDVISDLGWLLFVACIWSVIGIMTIRSARRDRRLLSEGNVAIAVINHQELTGGKHRRSEIHYEFNDSSGRRSFGQATDESRELYEDMETPVFYDPANPDESVPLTCACCDLKLF
jgi:hypothetical protein